MIWCDIEGYVVGIDGVGDKPVVGSGTIGMVFCAQQSTVGSGYEGLRHPDGDAHRVGFVGDVIFDGPPYIGAFALAGSGYPMLAGRGFFPTEAAIPGGVWGGSGLAAVLNGGGDGFSGLVGFAGINPEFAPYTFEGGFFMSGEQRYGIYVEQGIEIEYEPVHRMNDAGMNPEGTGYLSGVGENLNLQVVVMYIIGSLFGHEITAGIVDGGLRAKGY
jgi:hypothetical protein